MKKDINYIQALEKAVKDKYGEIATANPKQFWDEEKEKQFLKDLSEVSKKEFELNKTKELVESDGILIPIKLLNKSENKICKLCNKYSFNKKDDVYLNRFKVCYKCYCCELEGK